MRERKITLTSARHGSTVDRIEQLQQALTERPLNGHPPLTQVSAPQAIAVAVHELYRAMGLHEEETG